MSKEDYIRNGLKKWYETVGQKTEECDNDDNFNKMVNKLTKEYEEINLSEKKVEPCGVTFEVEFDDEKFYVHLYVDFDNFKVYGNPNIDVGELIVFDENFDKVPYSNEDIYNIMEGIIMDKVINEM
jgi:hypothetical protein